MDTLTASTPTGLRAGWRVADTDPAERQAEAWRAWAVYDSPADALSAESHARGCERQSRRSRVEFVRGTPVREVMPHLVVRVRVVECECGVDAAPLLAAFAREQAASVAHMWPGADDAVHGWLKGSPDDRVRQRARVAAGRAAIAGNDAARAVFHAASSGMRSAFAAAEAAARATVEATRVSAIDTDEAIEQQIRRELRARLDALDAKLDKAARG